jgi:hypothetical protein
VDNRDKLAALEAIEKPKPAHDLYNVEKTAEN